MPLCTLHLLALHHTTPNPLSTFLSTLQSSPLKPLIVSRVIRWIILPTTLSTEHLLARNITWDILLVAPGTSSSSSLPPALANLVHHAWTVTAGVPSRLLTNFAQRNDKLLHPDRDAIPPLTAQQQKHTAQAQSSQNLELSAELNEWIDAFVSDGSNSNSRVATGAVSMFNLLSFVPGRKEEYLKYGAAFAESVGSRHGGDAKIVGSVTHVNGRERKKGKKEAEWDEIALAHYPSIAHFRDMLASADYQEVNHRYRVGSLRDTCILMTSEIVIEEEVVGGGGGRRARL